MPAFLGWAHLLLTEYAAGRQIFTLGDSAAFAGVLVTCLAPRPLIGSRLTLLPVDLAPLLAERRRAQGIEFSV